MIIKRNYFNEEKKIKKNFFGISYRFIENI